MRFDSLSDFLVYIATAPGFIWNLLVHTFWLVFYYIPIIIWDILVSLFWFVLFLPVFIYKIVVWFWTFAENTAWTAYQYLFVRDWTWTDLGIFPALPDQSLSFALSEGINTPFDQFAGDYSVFIKDLTEPLERSMNWIRDQLLAVPWPFFFLAILLIVWFASRSRGVLLLALAALLYIGFADLSVYAYQTMSLMVISIILCVSIGVPIGVAMSFSSVIERMIKPILDVMQTMPSFVYLIPVLILFGPGPVAGLIAVFIYATPPVIRLTNLGIRLVSYDVIEAANAFGATYRQLLFGVQIPLALPNIFAGINQTIMMALAMVVIAALVGAPGLGNQVLSATNNSLLGSGLLNGFAIVLIAIVIDRTFHAYGERLQQHRSVGH